MRTMPGPLVSAECFVGREDFIEQLLKRLGSSSIILYGMRRLGKTSVLKAIHEQHPPDLTMVPKLRPNTKPRGLLEARSRRTLAGIIEERQTRDLEKSARFVGGYP